MTDILYVSNTKSCMGVYASPKGKFADRRWRVKEASKVMGNVRLKLVEDIGGVRAHGREHSPHVLAQFYANETGRNKLPKFAQTRIGSAEYETNGDGRLTLSIIMPQNLADYVPRRVNRKSKPKEDPNQPKLAMPETRYGLRELVRLINERKAEMGDELVLSVDSDGNLKAMVEYS